MCCQILFLLEPFPPICWFASEVKRRYFVSLEHLFQMSGSVKHTQEKTRLVAITDKTDVTSSEGSGGFLTTSKEQCDILKPDC